MRPRRNLVDASLLSNAELSYLNVPSWQKRRDTEASKYMQRQAYQKRVADELAPLLAQQGDGEAIHVAENPKKRGPAPLPDPAQALKFLHRETAEIQRLDGLASWDESQATEAAAAVDIESLSV